MNITTKIIITDTNILTDLSNANVLEEFINLDNVYMSDIVKCDEINSSTGKIGVINKIKTISSSPEQINEMIKLSSENKKLSTYDIIGFITARDNGGILATGDNRLRIFSEENNVEVIRTLKIIELLAINKIISIKKAINACELLQSNEDTRIPKEKIEELIDKLKKDL